MKYYAIASFQKTCIRSTALLIVALFAFRAAAQLSVKDSVLFGKNHFSIQLDNGIHRVVYSQTGGTLRPDPWPGLRSRLMLGCTFNINPSFGVLAEAGAGVHVLRFSGNNQGMSLAQMTESMAASFIYRLPLNNRHLLQFRAGPGLSSYGRAMTQAWFETYDPGSDNWQSGTVNVEYLGVKPCAIFGTGLSRLMRNGDLMSLNLLWEQSFSSDYTGSFMLSGGKAAGTLRNGSATVSLGVAYQFTYVVYSKNPFKIF